ncbi:hypothetical protein FRB97_008756 [Tulasnella sp. 331]|nr:hypothetical protein FRB97_008756 [Tulasnella sp. 331]KAG8888069.1 hypothetical protein FRB98_008406 [Tulasnella sp. 332]
MLGHTQSIFINEIEKAPVPTPSMSVRVRAWITARVPKRVLGVIPCMANEWEGICQIFSHMCDEFDRWQESMGDPIRQVSSRVPAELKALGGLVVANQLLAPYNHLIRDAISDFLLSFLIFQIPPVSIHLYYRYTTKRGYTARQLARRKLLLRSVVFRRPPVTEDQIGTPGKQSTSTSPRLDFRLSPTLIGPEAFHSPGSACGYDPRMEVVDLGSPDSGYGSGSQMEGTVDHTDYDGRQVDGSF